MHRPHPATPATPAESAWAASMVRQRAVVNALAGAAVAEGVTPSAVAEALRAVGAGVDATVGATVAPDAVDTWSRALVRATMRAMLARQWSPRTATPWTLTHLVPALLPHLDVDDAAAVVADAAFAADQVWRSGDVARWGDLLLAAVADSGIIDGPVSRTRLRDIGVVAAWRAGHVRLRAAAHRIGPTLPPAVLAAAVGLPSNAGTGSAVEALRENAVDPTAWPTPDDGGAASPEGVDEAHDDADRALRRLGGFTAYGGPFSVPPRVVDGDGDGVTWRLDAAGSWELLVDVHGDHLRRVPADGGRPAASRAPERSQRGRAVLVTSPRSHALVYARASHS